MLPSKTERHSFTGARQRRGVWQCAITFSGRHIRLIVGQFFGSNTQTIHEGYITIVHIAFAAFAQRLRATGLADHAGFVVVQHTPLRGRAATGIRCPLCTKTKRKDLATGAINGCRIPITKYRHNSRSRRGRPYDFFCGTNSIHQRVHVSGFNGLTVAACRCFTKGCPRSACTIV